MIRLYTNTKHKDLKSWIMKNDWYFNLNTGNQTFTEKERHAIAKVDQAKLTEDKHIETKYGVGTIRNLSSGCKTLLNIMMNPERVVNIDECGKNVLDIIFTMEDISVYMSRPERIDIAEDKEILFNDSDLVIGKKGYENWWTTEYKRREEENDL